MIKIIKGKYGLYDGEKVIGITPEDDPIELDAKKEAELVAKGAAVYVEKQSGNAPQGKPRKKNKRS